MFLQMQIYDPPPWLRQVPPFMHLYKSKNHLYLLVKTFGALELRLTGSERRRPGLGKSIPNMAERKCIGMTSPMAYTFHHCCTGLACMDRGSRIFDLENQSIVHHFFPTFSLDLWEDRAAYRCILDCTGKCTKILE